MPGKVKNLSEIANEYGVRAQKKLQDIAAFFSSIKTNLKPIS